MNYRVKNNLVTDDTTLVQMRKTRLAMSRAVNLSLCVLAVLSTLLQLVSFASHGWGIWTDRITKRSVYIGLWYSVVCDSPTGYCASISHHDEHQKNVDQNELSKEPQYAMRVWGQIIVTFAVLFCVLGSIFIILSCRIARHKKRFNLGATVSLLSSGFLLLTVIGLWASEISARARNLPVDSKNIYQFPWSLLVGGLGSILALITGSVKFLLLCLELEPDEKDGQRDSTYIPMAPQGPVSCPGVQTEEGSEYPTQDTNNKRDSYSRDSYHSDVYNREYPTLEVGKKSQLISSCDQHPTNECSVKCML